MSNICTKESSFAVGPLGNSSLKVKMKKSAKTNDQLFSEMKAGCPHAKNRIIEQNLGLVGAVSRKYIKTSMMYDDIFQEGSKGLIRAVEKFDPSMGFKFSTYASRWISSFIESEISSHANIVNVPERTRKLSRKLGKMSSKYAQQGYSEQEIPGKIAESLGIDRDKVCKIIAVRGSEISLNAPVSGSEGDLFFQDTLCGDDSVEEKIINDDQFEKLRELVSKLPKQRQIAVSFYHGLMGVECDSFADVAEYMGVSRQRVNVLYREGISDIRKMMGVFDGCVESRMGIAAF
jgi:RNA polymerase sigma factor (sigma-70 family)